MNGRMRVFRLVLAAALALAPAAAHAQESEESSSLTIDDVATDLGNLLSWFDRQLEKGAAASRNPDQPQAAPATPQKQPESKPAEPTPAAEPAEPKPAEPKPAQAEPAEKPESGGGGLLSWIDEQLEKGAAASRNPDTPQVTPAAPQPAPEPPPAEKPAVKAEVKPAPPPDFVPPQEPIVLTDRPDAAKGKGAARGLLVAPLKP